MLSYMVPVEQKPPPAPAAGAGRLALQLAAPGSPEAPARRALRTAISKDSSTSSFASDLTLSSSTPTGAHDKPKHKLLANGSKHTSLKRALRGMVADSIISSMKVLCPRCSWPLAPTRALRARRRGSRARAQGTRLHAGDDRVRHHSEGTGIVMYCWGCNLPKR